MISPASWEKIITGITDDRRVAKPPRKSALPYRVAERSAKTIVAIALQILESLESEPSIAAASARSLGIGRKPG